MPGVNFDGSASGGCVVPGAEMGVALSFGAVASCGCLGAALLGVALYFGGSASMVASCAGVLGGGVALAGSAAAGVTVAPPELSLAFSPVGFAGAAFCGAGAPAAPLLVFRGFAGSAICGASAAAVLVVCRGLAGSVSCGARPYWDAPVALVFPLSGVASAAVVCHGELRTSGQLAGGASCGCVVADAALRVRIEFTALCGLVSSLRPQLSGSASCRVVASASGLQISGVPNVFFST